MPALTDLKVDWVSLVDRAAVRDPVQQSEPMRLLLWKRADQTPAGGDMKTAEELQAALTKAETDAAAALKKAQDDAADALKKKDDELEDLKAQLEGKKTPEKKADEINKDDLPPAVRAALEKSEQREAEALAKAEAAEKSAKEAGDIAKAERDARLTATFITKAEGYKALVVKADEFGPVLKEAAEKLSKASFDELDRVLKAADEAIAHGDLFKEQGRSGDGNRAEGAYAEVTAKAEEIRKADPKVPLVKAMDMAFAADPALQARYLAEQRA